VTADTLYQETYRPQFHFTPARNWTNDPNGLVYYKGEYHLFFQHNPHGINWGNMTWGHAVSPDMVHWTQLDHAIHPDRLGTIFSGSAVVDRHNTTGFQTGGEKPIVCIYTSAGGTSPESEGQPFTQSIAFSTDRGRAWRKFEGNPVLGHIVGSNRDPKVIWHEPTGTWVMALFLDKNDYALFGSPNLKEWRRLCDVGVPGASECPDLFELAVDGDPADTRWVFWGANGRYLLGTFDGTTYVPESGPHLSNWGAHCYAAQTWSNIPPSDGRRLQIAWMAKGKYPGMPFNQQMSFPRELALRTTPDGIRLFIRPVREIENIRAESHWRVAATRLAVCPPRANCDWPPSGRPWADVALQPGDDLLAGIAGELFDIRAEIELGTATRVAFTLRGQTCDYDVAGQKLSCLGKDAPLPAEDGRIHLQILLDRTSIEVFGNDGAVSLPTCFLPDPDERSLGLRAEGGEARILSLDVHELRSAWEPRP